MSLPKLAGRNATARFHQRDCWHGGIVADRLACTNLSVAAVHMVIPFAAGGAFDVMGRILAARMSEILGQQVIIENTTGAAGIGVNRVVNAAPDGYTLLFGSIGTHAYNQTIYKKPRVATSARPPVSPIRRTAHGAECTQDFPADNLPAFVDYVKANNAKLQFGSAERHRRPTSDAHYSTRRSA